MLGKLIKNEFKANSHSIGMIYIVAAVAGRLQGYRAQLEEQRQRAPARQKTKTRKKSR